MLLLAIEWGGIRYAWNSATVIGMLCGAAGLFTVFIIWERRHGDLAMIPPSLMGNRAVFASCITSLFNGGGIIVLSYYLPIYFQATRNASPTSSGVYMLPSFVSQVLMAIICGASLRKIKFALPALLLGTGLITASYGLFTTLKIDSSAGEWTGYQILAGAGRGIALQMPVLVVQSTVAKGRLSIGTAMVMWSQFIGTALFAAFAQTIFIQGLKKGLHEYAPSLDATLISSAGATGFAAIVPAQDLQAVKQAYANGIDTDFYLGLALAIGAFLCSFGVGRVKVDGVPLKGNDASESKPDDIEKHG